MARVPGDKPVTDIHGGEILIRDRNGNDIGAVHQSGITGTRERRIGWLPARDTCDLDKVRLIHLDGSPVNAVEYDRIQRFIRLWRRLGWSIDDTDRALEGLSQPASAGGGGGGGGGISGGVLNDPGAAAPPDSGFVGFDEFIDNCTDPGIDAPRAPAAPPPPPSPAVPTPI